MSESDVRQPRPRRKNGFTTPYTTAQMSTWVALPTLVLEFLFVVSPLLPFVVSIPCTIIYVLSAAASAYFGAKAMTIDPADPRIIEHNPNDDGSGQGNSNGNGNNADQSRWDPNETTKHCWICRHDVSEKSMHCKFCNKCVHTFDHHCMWLNTCVGKANYAFFFKTMLSIAAMLTLHCGIQIGLILDIFLGSGASMDRAESWFGSNKDASLPAVIIMGVFILFDVVALSLIAQLLHFHIHLRRKGLTTYQFIYQENRKKGETRKLKRALESRRMVAMGKAEEEGRTCDWFQLHMGGILREKVGCTRCDPLKLEGEEKEKEQQQQKKKQPQEKQETVAQNGTGAHAVASRQVNEDDPEESKQPEEDT